MHSVIKRAATVVGVAALVLLVGSAEAQTRTEIHFWHAMGGQLGETVNELVKQFNQSQGEYEVKALNKGTYPEVLTSAIAAYRQKNPPHIVQVFEVGTQTMLLSGAVVPIYELMKQQEIAVNWDDFIAPVTGYYSKDGKLYSMPFNSSSPILYYNKDAFKKAGLPDKPPATWKEVEAASKKILAAGAAKCGFTTSWPSWTMLENTFAWHNQPFATNDNGYKGLDTKLLINSDFGLMHIGTLAKWQKENIYSYGGRAGQPDPKFINGDCAMLVQSSAVIGGFKKSIKFDWGTGQLPNWGPPYKKQNTIVGGRDALGDEGAEARRLQGRGALHEVPLRAPPADVVGGHHRLRAHHEERGQEPGGRVLLQEEPRAVDGHERAAQCQAHTKQPGHPARKLRPDPRRHRGGAGEHLRRQEDGQGRARRRGGQGQRDPQGVRGRQQAIVPGCRR